MLRWLFKGFNILASLANLVPISAMKDPHGGHHLIQTNLELKSSKTEFGITHMSLTIQDSFGKEMTKIATVKVIPVNTAPMFRRQCSEFRLFRPCSDLSTV